MDIQQVVYAAITGVIVMLVGGFGFFATRWANGIQGNLATLGAADAVRTERIAMMNGRIGVLESSTNVAMTSIDRRLEKIERVQDEMREAVAALNSRQRV